MSKIIPLFILLIPVSAAQASGGEFNLRGYIRETPILWKPSPYYFTADDSRRFDNLLHNRINLRWYPTSAVTLGFELKTRFYWGESAGEMQQSTAGFTIGKPYFDWERSLIKEDKTVLSSEIDRAWLDWYSGSLQITLGRQRIAWGTNLVWNPIDLFNPSSPLDFDNEEKPGADGGRTQYYIGPNSKFEFAIAPGRQADETTAAGLLMLNKWEYDWILIAGRRQSEAIIGGAWAGDIKGGGFRGEFLFAMPRSSDSGQDDYLTASISGDYTFKNSLYLHTELLYNQRGTTGKAGGMRLLEALGRGELTPSRLSLFGEIARDLSPLVRADISGIINPNDKSWYLGPSIVWSALTNLDLTAVGLIFGGETMTEFGDNSELWMLRAKWSF